MQNYLKADDKNSKKRNKKLHAPKITAHVNVETNDWVCKGADIGSLTTICLKRIVFPFLFTESF